jgi:hypothetical protein
MPLARAIAAATRFETVEAPAVIGTQRLGLTATPEL